MLHRVVSMLIAMVLMLFSASVALACSECHSDTAHCLVSLGNQAEEAVSADLEVVSSLDLDEIASKVESVVEHTERHSNHRIVEADGAAGVWPDSQILARHLLDQDHGLRSGRFSGATA